MKENPNKIHPDTRLGFVHLTVSDMERSLDFYEKVLGFKIRQQENGNACLGVGGDDLLVLTEESGARMVSGRTGLYHFAILVPSRLALAKSLKNLIETESSLQGFADHLVSEAVYLGDPDGNGIEIYRDRPPSDWEYENGTLKMGTEPFDFEGVLAELGSTQQEWKGLPAETVLGHMHLHVSDLSEAQNFYEQVIGFDLVMTAFGSAAFLSAGGYHHHIGINTWNGVGASAPPPGAVGLRYYTVKLPVEDELDLLTKRLVDAQIGFESSNGDILVQDPSQNRMKFVVEQV
jgi:catechol 2,3-dioxygenase